MTQKELKEKGYMTISGIFKSIKKYKPPNLNIEEIFEPDVLIGPYHYFCKEKVKDIIEYLNLPSAEKYKQTCLRRYGVENIFQLEEIKNKIFETNTEKYGFKSFNQSPQSKEKYKQTCLRKYGVENVSQIEEIKKKKEETFLKHFGSKCNFSSKELREKYQQVCIDKYGTGVISYKYKYDDNYFDSSWELAYYFYLKNENIDFEYHTKFFEYLDSKNNIHKYFPDFVVNGEIVEIKGNQFLDKDGKLKDLNPEKQYIAEAKQKCMDRNNVVVISNDEIKFYLRYCKEKGFNLNGYKNTEIVRTFCT